MADFIVSKCAADDLADIYAYTFNMFGERQAERYTRDLYSRFQLLAEFPGLGLPVPIEHAACLKFPTGSHVIYYRQAGSGVVIARVLHGAQDVTTQVI